MSPPPRKPTPANPLLCRAIEGRKLLAFDYKGRHRVVAPYCHGFTRGSEEMLRAVQVRGSSQSGKFGMGKLWNVAEMRDVQLLDELFVPDDPQYNPDDSAMHEIHCRV